MAPKRKPPVQCEGPDKKKGRQGTEEDSFRATAEALKAAPTEKRTVRVDASCPLSRSPGAQVHQDYDCTLNQTNIGNNNNKFYIIQLLEDGGRFACWNRWGRVVSARPLPPPLPPPAQHRPPVPRVPPHPRAPRTQMLTRPGAQHTAWHHGPAGAMVAARWAPPEGCHLQGEVGQSKLSYFASLEDAKKDFEKKFRDKTKNSWAEREHFVAHPGKYTLIEVQGEDEAQEAVVKVDGGPVRTVAQRVRPCSLDAATQQLITNIFSKDMFSDAMALMNLDVKKMPLGKLSKQQIARGFEALEALEAALKGPADVAGGRSLEDLSSHFYTVIPHNFGRSRPPPISSPELLQAKKDMLQVRGRRGDGAQAGGGGPVAQQADMDGDVQARGQRAGGEQGDRCAGWPRSQSCGRRARGRVDEPLAPSPQVLADIELAQTLQAAPEEEKVEEVPHPLDRDYQLLRCQLQLLDPEAPEYKVIHTYLKQTGGSYRSPELRHVWKVNRDGEGDRFQAHSTLGNRRLLWHGTNVAVVAAILTSGLRIMPHSGGRVGKGIYFASENSKSAGYVTTMLCGAHRIAYMFLGEVALGREHHITADEPGLKQPPPGFDSVIARGHTEPDPTQDTELELDGRRVAVPQGQPTPCPEFSHSCFSQSEYLIYQESQCRLRYLLEVCL
ncbi:hypothetical protein QTO34_007319 [Cnephaeus nilssonii]|uniref:Poly [ADP-ribose] polymerase n=1 Tax=Cnephaeus nilssonii TaxID=3371016 RepID=A0AA40HK02_CNENI|nr:hypothetical protein QTO34_007319 [Eptesicus nilssonii]